MADLTDLIRERGWRQGSVILAGDLDQEIFPSEDLEFERDDVLYVLTHDCDLVQPSLTKEPYFEILLLRKRSSLDGNFTFGKNSRCIDIELGESCYRASCHDRFRFDRSVLARIRPSEVHDIDLGVLDLITSWISKRYIRPAFPDEFNRRIARDSRAIAKFFKNKGEVFSQIYISCDSLREELADEEDYRISIWLLLADPNLPVVHVQDVVNDLEQILDGCAGISVDRCLAVTEEDVTIAHTRLMSHWDFDYMTFRGQAS